MIYRLTAPGLRPPSLNDRKEMVKIRGRLVPRTTDVARNFQSDLRLLIKAELTRLKVRHLPLYPKGVPVSALVVVSGAQRMDRDNLLKDTLDAMSRRRKRKTIPAAPGILWHDDSQLISSPPCFAPVGPASVTFYVCDAREESDVRELAAMYAEWTLKGAA